MENICLGIAGGLGSAGVMFIVIGLAYDFFWYGLSDNDSWVFEPPVFSKYLLTGGFWALITAAPFAGLAIGLALFNHA